MNRKKTLIAFILISITVVTLISGRDFLRGPAEPEIASNTMFDYSFMLKDLNNAKIDVSAYKGKVIFLNLWATWCGPCRAEMAGIQQLYSKVNKDDVVFIMLSLDREGQQQKIKSYIDSKQFSFPVFMPTGNLPQQLQVPSIPTTFIIDKSGKIVTKKVGSTNFDTQEYKTLLETLAAK
jgi:thiol-disulfide isomerase/thioredoxin